MSENSMEFEASATSTLYRLGSESWKETSRNWGLKKVAFAAR